MELRQSNELKRHLSAILTFLRSQKRQIDDHNLSAISGFLGRAVCLAEIDPENSLSVQIINDDLARAFDLINTEQVNHSFVDGLCGAAWGMAQISRAIDIDGLPSALSELDQLLHLNYAELMRFGKLDYFYGALGYASYFISRAKENPRSADLLDSCTLDLLHCLVDHDGNLRWFGDEFVDTGVQDLSMSHGLGGAFGVLLELHSISSFKSEIMDVCQKMATMLIQSSVSQGEFCRIPDSIEQSKSEFAPLRWCHGDLGPSVVLAKFDLQFNLKQDRNRSKSIAMTLFQAVIEDQDIKDVTVCHGAFGNILLLTELSKLHRREFQGLQASSDWLDYGLKCMNSGIGYKHLKDDGSTAVVNGMLHGPEGIALGINEILTGSKGALTKLILV